MLAVKEAAAVAATALTAMHRSSTVRSLFQGVAEVIQSLM
jgi:hypothetical protein